MRVLVVHNRHRDDRPSGENRAVAAEIDLLAGARGVEVRTHLRSNEEIDDFGALQRAGLAVRPFYSRMDVVALTQTLREWRPDVVHVHNVYPLISPWIVRAARAAGIPVVHTVHNYRHVCAAGNFFRDGHDCRDCAGRAFAYPAIMHRCYRGSRPQSAIMAASLAVHRSTWRLVDRFLAISEPIATHLRNLGVPAARITVKPNAVADPGPASPPGRGALFAGRLDPEKGCGLLMDAWQHAGLGGDHRLVVAGDGPQRQPLQLRGVLGVRFVGNVSANDVSSLLDSAAVVVVPSLWNEPFGLTVVEAFAHGRPVVATRRGAPASMVDDAVGWLCDADPDSLGAALRSALDAGPSRGDAARRRYEELYSPARVLDVLLETYAAVIRGARGRVT